MKEISFTFFIVVFVLCFISCTDNKTNQQNGFDFSTTEQVDSIYMPTGFYFLTEKENGVKMKEES